MLDELDVKPTDILISKQANDSFYNTTLQSKLAELNTNAIVVTGTTTDFCIDSTVQSALSKDYHITVVKDGHTMSDRPGLKAEQLIGHYNTTWGYLTPTRGKIEVVSFEGLTKALGVMIKGEH